VCIRNIETALGGLAGAEAARVNLSTRRVAIRWRADTWLKRYNCRE